MSGICCLGDSITYGASDTEFDGRVGRLRSKLQEDQGFNVYNCGIGGDTVRGLETRVQQEIFASQPDIAIFAFGTNDSAYQYTIDDVQVPLEEFISTYTRILSRAQTQVQDIVVLGLTPCETLKVNPWKLATPQYEQAIQDICKKLNLIYVPVFDCLTTDDLEDGLHPTGQGHQKMFERIYKYIKPLIK